MKDKNYTVKVNDVFEFNIDTTTVNAADIVRAKDLKFHILQENKSYKAQIVEAHFNRKTYTLKVNNNTYKVDIHDDLGELIKSMGFEVGATKKVNEIRAPMPGLILDINVKVGQEVKEDITLLILEAMKMENIITSPRDGIIKSISAKKGDAVEKNQLLIEFE